MAQGVVEQLKIRAPEAFDNTPVLFAYLFGSQTMGRSREDSDIDVAIYLEDYNDADGGLDATLHFTDVLARAARLGNLDVVVLNAAPLRLRGRVIKEGIVVHSRDEPTRVRFESIALRTFFDFQIHAREMDRQFLRDIAEGTR